MVKTGDKEKDYLLYLICCAIKQEDAQPPKENINTQKLLALAVKQQVYAIVLPCLEKMDILPEDEKEKWHSHKLSEIQKNLIVNSSREALAEELDEAGVKYIYVKGLVIRDYYPQSQMRQMSDNDIVYDASMRDELFRVMKNQGFYLTASQEASDDFYKAPCVNMEMHKKLFVSNRSIKSELDLWQRATLEEEGRAKYNISPDDNYIYSLAHMYKHYTSTGCGVRFLSDTYLLHYSDDKLDFDYINQKLDELGVLEFSKKVLHLVDAVFNDAPSNDEDTQLLEEIFAGGIFGIHKTLQENVEENGGKIGYIWHKIFPSMKRMKKCYEILEKKPYLLPFYYIKHFFLRYKNKGEKARKELKNVLKS